MRPPGGTWTSSPNSKTQFSAQAGPVSSSIPTSSAGGQRVRSPWRSPSNGASVERRMAYLCLWGRGGGRGPV
jgi:hypothetical protein